MGNIVNYEQVTRSMVYSDREFLKRHVISRNLAHGRKAALKKTHK